MNTTLSTRLMSIGFAAVVTFAMLVGVDALSLPEGSHASSLMAAAYEVLRG